MIDLNQILVLFLILTAFMSFCGLDPSEYRSALHYSFPFRDIRYKNYCDSSIVSCSIHVLIFIVIVIVILFVILNLLPVAFMYSYFDGKLNTEDCPVMNMQIHQNQNHSKIFCYSEHLKTQMKKIKKYEKLNKCSSIAFPLWTFHVVYMFL